MDIKSRTLAQGTNWLLEWLCIDGEESVNFCFDNRTEVNETVLSAIRQHGAWHLYCTEIWAGGDLSVFRPVADIVEKLSLPSDRNTKVIGLDSLFNLKTLSVSGNLNEVDFTKFNRLEYLSINPKCRGGNWHLCEPLQFLSINVPVANLDKLKALLNLRTLACGKGLKSLKGAAELPALKELRIGGTHLPSLDSLGDVPNLRLLMLNLMPKLTDLKGIEGASNLEELDVTQCGGLRDVSAISSLRALKKLTLHFCPHIKSLAGVQLPPRCEVSFGAGGKVGEGF